MVQVEEVRVCRYGRGPGLMVQVEEVRVCRYRSGPGRLGQPLPLYEQR